MKQQLIDGAKMLQFDRQPIGGDSLARKIVADRAKAIASLDH
jgi:hypothetical protein